MCFVYLNVEHVQMFFSIRANQWEVHAERRREKRVCQSLFTCVWSGVISNMDVCVCVCVSKSVWICRYHVFHLSPTYPRKWAEFVRRCVGLISVLPGVGGAYRIGDDNNRPMCFKLAFSILHGLPLNTKQQRRDAQSRPQGKACVHPSTLLCLPFSSTSPPTVLWVQL